MAYVRTVKTASGARAVQIVHGSRKGSRSIEHIGSAHTDADYAALRQVAAQRISGGQSELDMGLEALVPDEVGVNGPSYATIKRRLPVFADAQWRQQLATSCAAHIGLGPTTLVLYDVTTLYFETDKADGFREPGFSKERRLEPQITVGLLTDATGFPLMMEAFEGNRAETHTMLPTIGAFMAAIEAAGLSFILGERLPSIPYKIAQWHSDHPDSTPADGLVLTQQMPANPRTSYQQDRVTYYRYSADRARRSLRGINEQVAKAEKAVAGKIPVKRNRFVTLKGANKSVNRELETKARTLAGWKAYTTNIDTPSPDFVVGAYHQLWRIEKSFAHVKVRSGGPADISPD